MKNTIALAEHTHQYPFQNKQTMETQNLSTSGPKFCTILKKISILFLLIFVGLTGILNQVKAQNCTVNANVDQTICAGNSLTLVGSTSGLYPGGAAVTTWSQISGPSAVITSPGSLTTTVTSLLGGNTYKFRLSTNCLDGSLVYDDITITVSATPSTNAGNDFPLLCPGTYALAGNALQSGETGLWSVVSGAGITIASPTSATSNITLNSTTAGNSVLRWTKTNTATSCTSFDEVTIPKSGGVTPVNAGPDQNGAGACYNTTTSATLAGSFGGNGTGGQNGLWTVVSGPNIPTITTPTSNTSTVSNLIQGSYILRWTVSGTCASGTDDVKITIPAPLGASTQASATIQGAPAMPICDGRTSFILLGNSTLLANETGVWTQTAGPAGPILGSPNSPTTTLTNLNGSSSYSFRYTITNSVTSCTTNSTVNISYRTPYSISITTPSPYIMPCGSSTATIAYTQNGSGTAQYSILSGPTTPTITTIPSAYANAGSPLVISGLTVSGTYVVRMRKSEGTGSLCETGFRDITIVVSQMPTASNAGSGQVLACNVVTASLAGNVPTVGTGRWSQVSGPNTAVLANPLLSNTGISGLTNGSYTFRWLITGGSACPTRQADAFVKVASIPPTTANAGPDQLLVCYGTPIFLSANAPVLNETGTWTVNPSAGVTFSNVNSRNTVVNGLVASTAYTFTWTITNGCGSSADQCIVSTTSSQGPVQSVAGSDQCQPAGTTSITLTGNNPAPGTGVWTKLSGVTATITNPSSATTTVTGLSNSTYQFIWTITYGVCAVSRDTVMVTISAPVTVSAAGTDQTICGNSATLSANTPVVGTGAWSQVSGSGGVTISNPSSVNPTVTGMSDGSYTFRWTISNNACPNSQDDVQISASTSSTPANAGPDQFICGASTTATMAANNISVGKGYWSVVSGPSTPTITTLSSPITTITNLTTGTYIFRWNSSNGPFCPVSTDDVSVVVVPTANAGADQALCAASSATLFGNTSTTGVWTQVGSTPNVATITQTTSSTATASGLIPGTYTFTYTIGTSGCSTSDNMLVVISSMPSPAANAGPDLNLCNVTGWTNAANLPTTGVGSWTKIAGSNNPVFSPGNSPTSTVTGATAQSYVYEWRITNGSCVSADRVNINIGSISTANAGPDQNNVCGATATMAAIAPASGIGTWSQISGPGTASISSQIINNTTITDLLPGTYVFRWTLTSGICTPSLDDVSITVIANPTSANAGPDQNLCNVTSTALAGNAITTGTGLWSQISGPATSQSNTSSPTCVVSGMVPGTYVFQWTSTNGVCVTSDQVTLNNDAPPTVSSATPVLNNCLFSPVNLAGNTPLVGTGVWTQIAGPTVIISSPSSPTTSILGTNPGSYTFRWSISNGNCPVSTSDEVVVINDIPTMAAAGSDQTGAATCGLTTVTLSANIPATGTGQWSVVSGTGGSFSNSGLNNTTFNGISGNSYTLRWTISNGNCTSTDDVLIKFNQTPTVANAGPDQTGISMCGITQTTLAANTPSTGTGAWSIINGAGGAITTPSSPTSIFSGIAGNTYTLRWTISNSPCTASTDNVVITFNKIPAINNLTSAICSAEVFTITPANGTNGVVPAGTTYSWSAPSVTGGITGGASGSSSANIKGTLVNPTNSVQTATYTVTPTSGSCTGSTFTVIISVNPIPAITDYTTTICSGEPFTFTPSNTSNGVVPAGTTYSWPVPSTTGGISGEASGSSTSNISGTLTNTTNVSQTVTYTVTPVSGSCTGSTFKVIVRVNPKPAIANLAATICSGSSFAIVPANVTDGIVPSGTTYSWSAPSVTGGITGGAAGIASSNISGILINPTSSEQTAIYSVTPNSSGCNGTPFLVTITINPSPSFSNCPANISQSTHHDQCNAEVNYSVAAIGSPAPSLSYTFSGATIGSGSGTGTNSTFNKGITIVEITATNSCGSAVCQFTITVNDTQNPTISCPANINISADAGLCTASGVALGTPVTSDNCAVANVTNDAPALFPIGNITVTWTVTDSSGNLATCSQVVTVSEKLNAVNDVATSVLGSVGGTALNNVLINDKLNCAGVLSSQVLTTIINSTNTGVSLNGTSVVVAAGTPAGTYSLTYQICSLSNLALCSQATVSVTVTASVIDATNDTGSSVNGYAGGTSLASVLTNDLLNGSAVALAQVNLTQVSTDNSGVSLDLLTGAVSVAPGTPAGNYTLAYKICEKLNPDNCDQASVSVPVSAAVIDAVDGSGTVNGMTGGTTLADVLYNDLLNGILVNHSEVNLTLVSSTNPNVTLNTTTGAVNVAPGTAAGTYYVTYKICEILNPSNCDQAVSTANVTAAPILANSDAGSSVNGFSGGTSFTDILLNDKLNGVAVVPANVTLSFVSSTNPGVTLSGANVVVAQGTPASTYSLVYSICEVLNPANCSQTTVTVPVSEALINPVNDAGSTNGFVGGTAVTNVLANDLLNGAIVDPAKVNLSFVSSTNSGVTLSGTDVLVAPGTPAGTYILVYQICEKLNPANCQEAQVTVTVNAPAIDAIADAGGVNGKTGGIAITNVLSNDLLNNAAVVPANVNLSFVSATNPGITLSGSDIVVAAGTKAGSYTLTYRICEKINPSNCDEVTNTITVTAAAIVANADNGSVNGMIGGNAVDDVLTNDLLNGVPVVQSDIVLTQLSSTSPNVTLNITTGAVVVATVAPGTPAGTYTLKYQICEKLNPTNCATGTVTVTVTAAPILAINDSGNEVNSVSGGNSVTNVLNNDRLNGVAVDPTKVTLTFISSTSTNVTLNTTTGAVDVKLGTASLTYYLVYQICEKLNSSNCSQATVTVPVHADDLIAKNDEGISVNGFTGGTSFTNVMENDLLSLVKVDPANVTIKFISSTNTGVSLSGTNVVVAPGTPASTYSLIYEICDKINATNCSRATVTVPVSITPMIAKNDAGSANGFVGGTAVKDVLANDLLNGAIVDAAKVNLSFVSSTNSGVTLNGTDVLVAPGTPAGTYVLVYRICENLNPANCHEAQVTVTVDAPAIKAIADAGSVIGLTGGTAVKNVLSNDLLNGATFDPAKVNLSFVSATNPGITLSGSDIVVAAGTKADSYTLTYRICEKLNPTNCDEVISKITVTAALIDATDDAGTSVNGYAGGTSLASVLTNDLLNGSAVALAQVNLTQVSTDNSGVSLDLLTGAVSVAPGTPAGNYTLTYKICEKLNPDNCDQASVSVPVSAAVIDAVDGSGTVNGMTGGTTLADVLYNDLLNGILVNHSEVNLTLVTSTNPNVTLNTTTGAVNVAPGTAAGTYYVTYKICEKINPLNCDQAVSTAIVTAAPILANSDAGSSVNGFSGGTSFADVLLNDKLNGVAVVPANVTLSFDSSTNPGVTLSGTNVVVAQGTPASTYSLVYSICEVLNPANCSQTTVTVPVSEALINPVNDAGTTNGFVGGTAVTNVLANDLLNGAIVDPAKVNLSFVSSTNSGVTLSGTNVLVAPGTPAGTYTLVYQICEKLNPANCQEAEVTVTVNAPNIEAITDAGSVNGMTGGKAVKNVLSNDLLNGVAVDPAKVNLSFVSTTNPDITLNGSDIAVTAGTPAGIYTLTYRICEKINPANCDEVISTITVTAAVIDATNDAGTSVNGYAGGTSLASVLTNDLLNGSAVSFVQVNLTQVSTDNSGVSLDLLTGAVSVAPGTPAGNYTLAYKICEKLNPDNCDQASVSVPVSAAVIDAVDGSGTVNGMTGGTTLADVLYNDLINGELVHHSEVNLSFVSSTNPNVTLNTTTGAVNVAPETAAGIYYVTYKICEILNPANCDQAVSTAIVTAPPILAANDAGNANGMTGGTAISNVLSNDLLNETGIALAKINLTVVTPSTNAGVLLNTGTGEVTVSPGTQAGTYQITYQVCEKLNPTNCDQAIATITVVAASIQAKADSGFDVNGYTGGSSVSNILANDLLNGSPLAPSDVILSFVSSSSPNITLNGTAVLVAPGTPAGTYTLDYSICEKLNPSNCDVNTVTVIVTAPIIDATPDSGTANGLNGGTAVNNVLANDLLNGVLVKPTEVNTIFISSTNAGITLAGTNVIVAPGTAPGTYKLNYQICEKANATNCDETIVTITVSEILPTSVNDLNTTNEDIPVQGDVSTNDTRSGYGGNVWTLVGNNGGAAHGIVTMNPQGTYNYTPDPNYHGTDTFNYQLCDAFSNCSTATVNITINSVRDFPLAVNDVNSTDEDMPVNGNVAINDTQSGDGGNVWSLVGANGGAATGTVTMNSDGIYNYIPATGYFGEVSFYYQLCDADGDCSQALVTITIVNDMDGIAALNDVNTTMEDTPVNGNVSTNDTPSDEGIGEWKLSGINGGATHGTVAMNADGNYRYIPDLNYFGTDLFTYQQCDMDGDCVSATVTITITAVNDPPLALNDAATTIEDTPVTIAVTANDSDIDGTIKVSTVDLDPLSPGIQTTFTVSGQGTYSVDVLGTVTFTPIPEFNGIATAINYTVQEDNGATSNIATITINITPVQDPPVAINDNFSAKENQKLEENLLDNDFDADGNIITLDNTPVQPPAHGTLVLFPDGRFTYQPFIDFRGTDTFTYRICDNDTPSLCSTATVTILIGKDDDCAVFVPNSFSPNGDGIHDNFKVRCLYNYENPIIEIYNRWGNLVFKKDHYGDTDYWGSENDAWWTGRSDHKWTVGNELLPVGTYYYVLKLNNAKVLTGFLFLNK